VRGACSCPCCTYAWPSRGSRQRVTAAGLAHGLDPVPGAAK
jgi:hypothetical protein